MSDSDAGDGAGTVDDVDAEDADGVTADDAGGIGDTDEVGDGIGDGGDAGDADATDDAGSAAQAAGAAVESDDGDCSCKVGRNARKYSLDRFDRTLRNRRRDGASLRDLEAFVNQSILREALLDAGADVIGDVAAIYDVLTGDSVSAGERTEARARLEQAGVDVEAVVDDFVSYQTVRTHLRECLDVDTDRREPLSTADARGTVEWARSRSEGIVERTLERLARSEAIEAGDLDVSHVVRVTCEDCGGSYPVEAFIDRGGCECSSESG